MSEEQTFNKLRRCPLEEVEKAVEAVPTIAPTFTFFDSTHLRSEFLPNISLYLDRVEAIEKCGWTVTDFYVELERRAIISAVAAFNNDMKFPPELIDRARKTFPNIKITQASITLE